MTDSTPEPIEPTRPGCVRPLARLCLALWACAVADSAMAACGGIATAYCVSAFSSAETPPGVGAISRTGFSFLGPGAFSLTLADPISGPTGVDIRFTDGGEASVTTGGLVTGTAGDGVSARSATGPVAVGIGAGGVVATGTGVRAVSGGGGNVNVIGTGAVAAGGVGIVADSAGGNVFVNETGKITGSTGISAATTGAGGLTIMTGDTVTGTAGDGIVATTEDGLNALIVGAGGVRGSVDGAAIGATGTGGLSMSIGGSMTGGKGSGLVASTNSGAISISIDGGATLSGARSGLTVLSRSGQAKVNNNGVVTSQTGAALLTSMGSGSATFVNNGLLQGLVAAYNASGSLQIVNNATVDGMVTTAAGAVTDFNNIGTWTHAGGSTLTSFTNAGTLSLGAIGGAPDILTVTGDATLTSTSRWTPRLSAAGADRIAVGGVLTIGGGTLSIAITPGVYRMGRAYDLLTAGTLTGAFDHAYITGGYFTSDFKTTATGVSLTLGYGSLQPIAVTRNEKAVASALDSATRKPPTGAAETLLSSIYSQSGLAPLAALDQMNSDAAGAAANANLLAGHMFSETLGARETTLRSSRDEGDGWYTGARRTPPKAASGGVGVWSAGFGGIGAFTADKVQGSSAQRQSNIGAALGLDYRIDGFSLGVAGGISEGAFRAGAATGTTRGAHIGLYGGFAIGEFYTQASVSGARFANTSSRLVGGPVGLAPEAETASFGADEARTRVEAGWDNQAAGFHVSPFAAIEAAVLRVDRYGETVGTSGNGGLLGLSYAAQDTTSVPVFLGLRLNKAVTLRNGIVLSTKASVAWEYEFATTRSTAASLVVLPGTTFTVLGAQPGANAVQLHLGMEARVSRAVALFAALEGEFSAGYKSMSARGGAAIQW